MFNIYYGNILGITNMINDLHLFHHKPFEDSRGFFKEIFNNNISLNVLMLVKDNLSFSKKM
jgi:dTDP-4-dehydrorhamnose 3,5-epimerase-like enzyme